LRKRKRRERADDDEELAHQIIAEPPSTTSVWPVMNAASSLARKLTAPTGVFRVGERCFSLGSILAAAARPSC
jgi:hypothetical protein